MLAGDGRGRKPINGLPARPGRPTDRRRQVSSALRIWRPWAQLAGGGGGAAASTIAGRRGHFAATRSDRSSRLFATLAADLLLSIGSNPISRRARKPATPPPVECAPTDPAEPRPAAVCGGEEPKRGPAEATNEAGKWTTTTTLSPAPHRTGRRRRFAPAPARWPPISRDR